MAKKRENQLNKVSEEVRKQYDEQADVLKLSTNDVLPTPPVPDHVRIVSPPQQSSSTVTAREQTPTSAAQKPKKTAEASSTKEQGKEEDVPPLARPNNRIVNIFFATIVLFLAIVLVSAVLQRYFVGSTIIVRGISMEPSYREGEELWVNKKRKPKRGDIIVLYRYDVDNKFWAEFAVGVNARGGKYEKLIKRLVAISGDKIWAEETPAGYVLVIETPEGQILRENYYLTRGERAVFYDANGNLDEAHPNYLPVIGKNFVSKLGVLQNTSEENPFVVGEGKIFYVGDNRHNSSDSRDVAIKDVPWERFIGVVE